MLPEAVGRGQHFQGRGHSFSPYGPTLSWQITYIYFSEISLRNLFYFFRFQQKLCGTSPCPPAASCVPTIHGKLRCVCPANWTRTEGCERGFYYYRYIPFVIPV